MMLSVPQARRLLSGLVAALLLVGPGRARASAPAEAAEPAAPAAPAAAEVRPIEELDIQSLLDLAVVTASGGKAQTQSLAAANITVITRDEIAVQGWRSLAEVLSNVPGLYVIRDEVVPSLGVRGVTGGLRAGTRLVKVMINGVEVNFRPDLTAFLGPEYIPMEAVQRIEVAKGPLSAIYGANAFLAVVNVITRDQLNGNGEVALRGNAVRTNAGYGTSGIVGHGNADRGFLVAFGSDHFNRSGLRIEQTFPGQNPTLSRNRIFFADQSRGNVASPSSLFTQGRYTTGKAGRFSLQGGLQTLDAMGDFQLNSITTHQSRYGLLNLWGSLQHEYQLTDRVQTTVRLGASRGTPTRDERLFVNGSSSDFFERKFNATTYDGVARVAWTPFDRLS
ncbi:MAG: TonB-dependent receptor plug domain-containing protein, partial [Myxococcales bacterium]